MTTPKETTWKIEEHTRKKHEILRRYLGAWFPILGKDHPRIIYIDGFCGPGRYKDGEPGSPIIALQVAREHLSLLKNNQITFLFMDERADRIEHLKHELSEFSIPDNFNVYPQTGEFERILLEQLEYLEANNLKLAPTFAFIDPFGFGGLPFNLVKRLLGNPKTEVFITIMVNSINRFLEHPVDQTRHHIDDLFGTENVREIAQGSGDRLLELLRLYKEQLSTCAKFVRHFEMSDSHKQTIYYLFFASNHRLGHAKMKEAFWKVDPSSGFRFSDATNPNQLILLDQKPEIDDLLLKAFTGRELSIEAIEEYIEDKTAFIKAHIRSALIRLEDDGKITASEYKPDGKKRRKRTFPKGVLVEFK